MVNTIDVPVHPLAVGVTVIVATTGAVPVLVAVNEGISPVPLVARPMDAALFVHANVVPDTGPLKTIAAVVAPLQ